MGQNSGQNMEARIVKELLDKRWLLLCVSLLAVIASGYGFKYFYMDGSPRAFLGENNRSMNELTALENSFGRTNNAVILLGPADDDQADAFWFGRDELKMLAEFTDKATSLPNSRRVESLTNYNHSWSDEDTLIVESLLENADILSDEEILNAKEKLLNEDAILNRLVTPDGNRVGVHVQFNIAEGEQEAANASAEALFVMVEDFRQRFPHVAIYPSGTIVNDYVTLALAVSDTTVVLSLMYAVMFFLLAALMRSVQAMLIILFVTGLSVVAGVGFACWFGAEFASLTMLSFSIIIIVTIAHCVHFLLGFLRAYRSGYEKFDAIRDTLEVNLQPVFLTSITTIVGFLSMNISDMPPVRNIGNITAAGVGAALILTFTLLPALLSIGRFSNKPLGNNQGMESFIDRLAELVIERRNLLLVMMTLLSFSFLYLSSQNIINDKLGAAIERPHHVRDDNEMVDRYLGGIFNIQFRLEAPEGKTITDVEYLNYLDEFTHFLRQQPEVTNVFSFSDVIKRINQNMNYDDVDYYRIPKNDELAAQYLLVYELSLPMGADLENQVSLNKRSTRMVVTFRETDSKGVNKLRQSIREFQQKNLPSYMQFEGTSYTTIWTDLSPVALTASLKGALFALFLISLILVFVFKSLKYGLISLVPNLLPAAWGFGIWKLYSGELQFGLMMVLTMTIGIVVDDTVHFLSKYRRAIEKQNMTPEQAIEQTFRTVGPALTLTTIILVLGFLITTYSQINANSEVGIVAASVIGSALVLDYFMLPCLLLFFKIGANK